MSEFLMPTPYTGHGYGIGVMFAGLGEEKYLSLELSLDGSHFISVERDVDDPFYSVPQNFSDLTENTIYQIVGRIVTAAGSQTVETKIPVTASAAKTVRLFSQSRSVSTHRGGARAHPPTPPKVME